jgi:hypothetical protein
MKCFVQKYICVLTVYIVGIYYKTHKRVNMISNIIANYKTVPKTISYKLRHKIAVLEDEDEACKSSEYAYYFARDIPGADIEKCCEAACKEPKYAYLFAKYIPGADIGKCQEGACKNPRWAYWFFYDISGADKEKY